MTRLDANKQILDAIAETASAYPDLRFQQILQNLGISDSDGVDRWNEESEETLKRCSAFKALCKKSAAATVADDNTTDSSKSKISSEHELSSHDALDKINLRRFENVKHKVARAVKLCDNPVGCLAEGHMPKTAVEDIAFAVNLLEAAAEDLRIVCNHFDWDTVTCDSIKSACMEFGRALAILSLPGDADYDIVLAGMNAEAGLAALGQVLATLIRWNSVEEPDEYDA